VEASYGPLPFALVTVPSSPPPDLQLSLQPGSVQSYAVAIPARRLGPAIAKRKLGSNYGMLDAEAALGLLHDSLRTRTSARPSNALLLGFSDGCSWERFGACIATHDERGMLTFAWVSIKEPRYVGDDMDLVVHVCSTADAEGSPPWWRLLALPRRYAAISMLADCERELIAASR
jgi:hypothetical protein